MNKLSKLLISIILMLNVKTSIIASGDLFKQEINKSENIAESINYNEDNNNVDDEFEFIEESSSTFREPNDDLDVLGETLDPEADKLPKTAISNLNFVFALAFVVLGSIIKIINNEKTG